MWLNNNRRLPALQTKVIKIKIEKNIKTNDPNKLIRGEKNGNFVEVKK